ncbi:hypothetical protein DFH09DRAFT_901755, partial [Mycena vulgaris]
AQPAGRAAMDQHYKLLHAEEEIVRLNIEIHQLVTYMRDEEMFLSHEEECLREEGSTALAHQAALHHTERGCLPALHMEQLVKLSKEPRFTANLQPGMSVCQERHMPVVRNRDQEMCAPPPLPEDEAPLEDDKENGDSDDDDGEASEAFLNVVRIVGDNTGDSAGT